MVAPRKYPEELRERAIRLALDARKDPASRPGACARIGEQLGINLRRFEAGSLRPRSTPVLVLGPPRATRSVLASSNGRTGNCGVRTRS